MLLLVMKIMIKMSCNKLELYLNVVTVDSHEKRQEFLSNSLFI